MSSYTISPSSITGTAGTVQVAKVTFQATLTEDDGHVYFHLNNFHLWQREAVKNAGGCTFYGTTPDGTSAKHKMGTSVQEYDSAKTASYGGKITLSKDRSEYNIQPFNWPLGSLYIYVKPDYTPKNAGDETNQGYAVTVTVSQKPSYNITIDGVNATKWYGEDYVLGTPSKGNIETDGQYTYYSNKPNEEQGTPIYGSAKITSSYTFKNGTSSAGGLSSDGLSYTGNAPSTITSDGTTSYSPLFIMHPSGVNFNPTKTGFIYKGLSTSPSATLSDDISANGGGGLHYRELYGVGNHELTVRSEPDNFSNTVQTHVSTEPRLFAKIPEYYRLPEATNLPEGVSLAGLNPLPTFKLAANAPSVDFTIPWEPLESTIHYIANGGEGEMESTVYTPLNGATTVKACEYTPTDPAQKFIEWNTESNGSGTSYNPGDDIRLDEKDVYLYAQGNYRKMYISIPDSGEGKKVYIDVSVEDKGDN